MVQDANDYSYNEKNYVTEIGDYPLKIVALGGLDEMGKNCYVIEIDNIYELARLDHRYQIYVKK